MTNIKRFDTAVVPRVTVTNSDGTAYSLTNHTIKFNMWYTAVLQTTLDNSTATVVITGITLINTIQTSDILIIADERMTISSTVINGSNIDISVTRGVDITATAGFVFGSTDVAGTGATIYDLSANATFTLSYDGVAGVTVTVTDASTSGNTTIAHLVTDVQSGVDSALGAGKVTVGSSGDVLKFTSDTTGTSSSVVISAPSSIATDELGIVAGTGVGKAAQTITAIAHTAGDTVRFLAVSGDGVVEDASGGIAKYQWEDGDTDKTGSYIMEFEIINSNGNKFSVPTDSSYTMSIVFDGDAAK